MLKRRLKSVMFVHVYKKLVQKVTLTLQMHSIISFHVKMLIVVYLCCSEDSPLYCICRTPHDPERFYVGCEDCRYVHDNTKSLFKDSLLTDYKFLFNSSEWFHGDCVGVKEGDFDQDNPDGCSPFHCLLLHSPSSSNVMLYRYLHMS
jgi:hypothetical protein